MRPQRKIGSWVTQTPTRSSVSRRVTGHRVSFASFYHDDDLLSGRRYQVRMLADRFESAYHIIVVEFFIALLRVEHYIV